MQAWLRDQGADVLSLSEAGLLGCSDDDVLARAVAERRVVLTHDRDFGRLAVAAGAPVFGIVYLRPGHIEAAFTIASLRAVMTDGPDLEPPFLLVVSRVDDMVTMRLRRLPPER